MNFDESDPYHDEVWDDSLLIDSWNQALREYKVRPRLTGRTRGRTSTLTRVEVPQHPRERRKHPRFGTSRRQFIQVCLLTSSQAAPLSVLLLTAEYRADETLKIDESGSQPVTEAEKHIEDLPGKATNNVRFEASANKICHPSGVVIGRFQLTKRVVGFR